MFKIQLINGFGNENIDYPYHEYLSQTKESWAFVNNVYSLQKTFFFLIYHYSQNPWMKSQMSTQYTLHWKPQWSQSKP
jgi:hypothetical protein